MHFTLCFTEMRRVAIQYIKRAVQLPNLRILQSGVAFKTEGTFKRDGA